MTRINKYVRSNNKHGPSIFFLNETNQHYNYIIIIHTRMIRVYNRFAFDSNNHVNIKTMIVDDYDYYNISDPRSCAIIMHHLIYAEIFGKP